MEYKRLRLCNGGFTKVDADDYETLSQFKWYRNPQGYAYRQGWARNESGKNEHWHLFLHRVVNKTPEGMFTDHVNQNKLDNRKENLRTADKSRNGANRQKPKKTRWRKPVSQWKGVHWNHRVAMWEARIIKDGKSHTTYHRTEAQAALDYNRMATELFGEFACPNVVPEGTEATVRRKKLSKFRGVSYHAKSKRWRATIEIGQFEDELEAEAARAYNKVCAWLRGPLAILNDV